MELVLHPEHFPTFTKEQILDFLKERQGKLNGVAITGGEPLLNKDIEDLLIPIKELGYTVKLDTNGFFPEMIEKLIDDKLVDRFAMDVKAGWNNYLKVAGVASTSVGADTIRPDCTRETCEPTWKSKLEKSIKLLMNKANDYEFRTTCVKGLHTEEDFHDIKEMIKGAKNYFLQNYKAAPDMKDLPFKPFTREELEHFKNIVKDSVQNSEIRGVD